MLPIARSGGIGQLEWISGDNRRPSQPPFGHPFQRRRTSYVISFLEVYAAQGKTGIVAPHS
jgi:hypothetical protein